MMQKWGHPYDIDNREEMDIRIREFAKDSRIREGSRNRRSEERAQVFLYRYLLIFNDRIFDSSVEAGIPSFAAAPWGPETRPPVAARADSISSFSCTAGFLVEGLPFGRGNEDSELSQLGSTENSSDSQTITDRSITFCSSRMFPGQP